MRCCLKKAEGFRTAEFKMTPLHFNMCVSILCSEPKHKKKAQKSLLPQRNTLQVKTGCRGEQQILTEMEKSFGAAGGSQQFHSISLIFHQKKPLRWFQKVRAHCRFLRDM